MFFHYWKFAKNAPFVFKDIQGVSFAFFNVAIMLFGATACNVSRYVGFMNIILKGTYYNLCECSR